MSIATELTRIQTAKADIKSAIEAKGVTVPSNALIDEYDTYIAQISGGGSGSLIDLIERDLTSIDIPNGTTTIGNNCFYNCQSLSSVTIPNSVTTIGFSAFRETALTNIVIPDSVTAIGTNVFATCQNLLTAEIGSGITTIGNYAFSMCGNVKSVTIHATTPPTLEGTSVFDMNNCPIYVPAASVEAYKAATNWSEYASRIQAIPFFLTATYNIVDTVNPTKLLYGTSVISSFTSMEIDGVLQSSVVDTYTFDTAGEHTVKYALADPTQIGGSVLSNCTSLTSVTIPDSVTTIGSRAFSGCTGLTSVTIPNSVTTIYDSVFRSCTGLTSVTIGNSVTSFGDSAFRECTGLTSVTIPDSIATIGSTVFQGCSSLTRVNSNVDGECIIPNGITTISSGMFRSCIGFTSVTIPNSVGSIGASAFRDCTGITRVNSNIVGKCIIPNTITTAGNSAFNGCTGLTSVTIPNSITSISQNLFAYCTSLTSITVEATTPPTLVNVNAFSGTNNCPIYVPAESVNAYKTAQYWSTYADRIQAIS